MFEWFFGHPEKKAKRDWYNYCKLLNVSRKKLIDNNVEDCKKYLRECNSLLIDLEKRINDMNSFLENKFKGFRKEIKEEILINHDILEETLKYNNLSKDCLKLVADVKGAIEVFLQDIAYAGNSKEEIKNEFKNCLFRPIYELKEKINNLIKMYDYLKYIHLTDKELEFYIRKERVGTKIIGDFEIAHFLNKKIVGRKFLYKYKKKIYSATIKKNETGVTHREHTALIEGKEKPYKNSSGRYESQFCPKKFNSITDIHKLEWSIIHSLDISTISLNSATFDIRGFYGFCYPTNRPDNPVDSTGLRLFFYFSPKDREGHYHSFPNRV